MQLLLDGDLLQRWAIKVSIADFEYNSSYLNKNETRRHQLTKKIDLFCRTHSRHTSETSLENS